MIWSKLAGTSTSSPGARVPARTTGQTALSEARHLHKFGAPPTMQIRAPEAPREARRIRRPHLERGAP
eukprot:5963117-Alexandrium_andersonii.AAC.1